jgi:hypothetical protein
MYIAFTNRISLLSLLPKFGRVAEIGVAEGEFSQEILARTTPKHLHLIDPWVHQEVPGYPLDGKRWGGRPPTASDVQPWKMKTC